MKTEIVLAASIFGAMSGTANGDTPSSSFGIWRDPQNSVHVRGQPCGERMCGVVVWANAKAKEEARRGGTKELEGLILFRGFVRENNGQWRGKVFVPYIGKTFSGIVTQLKDGRLKGKGCLAGGIICKSQVWSRVR